jgi:molecular chaperone IbpA
MVNTFSLDLFKDPFFIGWDRHFQDLEKVMHNSTSYPPYNLVEVSEDTYMIELALAGFKKEDISIEQEKNVLTIKGSSEEDENKYIHKGIGARAFTRAFSLSEYMNVAGVVMENGVLRVLIVKLVPEEARPKTFEILDSFTPEEKVFAPSSRKRKKEIV